MTYSQSTGEWRDTLGRLLGTGYSGHGPGLNNPAMQNVKDVGPLPAGKYSMGQIIEHDPVVGEFAIPLIPDPANKMFGRDGFFIHGNDAQNDHSASEGCIVLPLTVRQQIWMSLDHELEVVA